MIRGHSCLHKSRMTDWKGWSSSYLNLMCNKEEEALMSQHTVMTDFTLHCLKDYYIIFFIGTFHCMLLHERLLHTFKWLFFPHNSLSAPLFFSSPLQRDTDTLCRSSRSSKHWDRLWKEAEAGEPREPVRRARCAYRAGPTLPSILQRDFTTFQEMYPPHPTPASNQSTQNAHYGLPSPRKKMRFFAIFWLRVCMVSAFCRVRWAQSFQNLGSFSDSVRDDKADKLGS